MELSRPLAFIDIESTGPNPETDRIVEVGVCVLQPAGHPRKVWSARINPGIPIPPEATEVHGITDADVAACKKFAEVGPLLHKALAGKDLAGYNLRSFDLVILDEEFRRIGLRLELGFVRIIDCFNIFRKKAPRDLAAAVKTFCGREITGAHSALADAVSTAEVYLGQMAAFGDLSTMPLNELSEFCRMSDQREADLAGKLYYDQQGYLCFNFGQHKGKKIRDRVDYAEWMLRQTFPGSTRDFIRAELNRIHDENLSKSTGAGR